MNVNLKLSGLYSSLFVIRFSLIFQKKLVVGGKQKRAPFCCKMSQKLKGALWGHFKISKEKSQGRKNRKGDPLVSFGFLLS